MIKSIYKIVKRRYLYVMNIKLTCIHVIILFNARHHARLPLGFEW